MPKRPATVWWSQPTSLRKRPRANLPALDDAVDRTYQEEAMKYLLMLYADEIAGSKVSEEDIKYYMGQIDAWSQAMEKAGVHNTFQALHPTSAATTVRVPNGKKVVTHGPFAETKEQLGGFYLIDAK